MKTFYDILKVKENATKEEILNSYYKLQKKYINNSEILNKIKIAKEVLTNTEARENYDIKLNEMRQNELINNISNNTINYNIKKLEEEKRIEEKAKQLEIKNDIKKKEYEEKIKQLDIKSDIKKKEQEEKAKQLEIKNNIKKKEYEELKRQKEQKREEKKYEKLENKINKEQEKKKKELYEEAYANYLEGLGFKVKRRWTVKRLKRLIVSIIILIVVCFILWNIPSVREKLTDFYNNNFVIKMLVDLIINIINSVINWIKRFVEGW